MQRLFKQGLSFIAISGIGWVIDFTVYSLLVILLAISVQVANMISAVPAVTFVFFMSTRKTFAEKPHSLKLRYKYIIYFIYQIILLLVVSWLAQMLYNRSIPLISSEYEWLFVNLKIIIKIIITPVTMLMNFFVMKTLIEKI